MTRKSQPAKIWPKLGSVFEQQKVHCSWRAVTKKKVGDTDREIVRGQFI